MRLFRFSIPLFCFCFFALSFNANANEAEIATVKKLFQGILDYQKDMTSIYGDAVTLEYEGELTVVPQEGYYAVTLPNIKLTGYEDFEKTQKTTFDIGVIKANTMRGDKAGEWKTIMVIPSTYSFPSPDGKTLTVNIGSQQHASILDEKLGYFTKQDFKLGDVTVTYDGETLFNAPSLSMLQNWASADGKTYSGPMTFALQNLVVQGGPDKQENVTFGELAADISVKDIVLPTLDEYKAKILAHKETFAAMSDPENAQNLDDQAVMNMLGDLYDFDLDGFALEYRVKDVNVVAPSQGQNFQLAAGKFGLNFGGLKSASGTLGVNFGYSGVTSSDEPVEYKDIMPREANISLTANNIPVAELTDLVSTTMESIAANPEMAQMAGIGVMMKVPMLLSQAGTKIEIADTYAKANSFDTTITGTAKADITAVTSVTADIKSVIAGLDQVIAIADQYKTAESEAGMYYTQLAGTLAKLKEIGTPTTSNGKPAHEFNFQVTPQGQMTINGQDAAMVMGP